MSAHDTAIVWLRRDLRLADQPALHAALRHQRLIVLYIHEPDDLPGGASAWWLHHSLTAFDQSLHALGQKLIVQQGRALDVLQRLIAQYGVGAVYWNRLYTPKRLQDDAHIKRTLREAGLHVQSFHAHLLHEPWQVLRKDQPYKVFTPYWKACMQHGIDHAALPRVTSLPPPASLDAPPISSLGLLPKIPWDQGLSCTWQVGENAAWQALEHFVQHTLAAYATARNLPAEAGSSKLSPYLAFGETSPRQIVHRVRQSAVADSEGARVFLSELGWREFGYHLLYHFPHTLDQPLNPRWQALRWPEPDASCWQAWTRGQTGIPLVDAGMRELWHTGWMHNRVRMNVASLLVKNMLIPWQHGERWFADTLVDFDLASNVQGWQWTAGCGADAAPYFRVFNPVLQGEKFDAAGDYVRRWVPELARLPARWIHRPWEAPSNILLASGIRLDHTYPRPVVDLAASRVRALDFFAQLKAQPTD